MSVKLSIDVKFLGVEDDNNNHENTELEVNGKDVGECLSQYLLTKPDLKKDFFDRTGKLARTTFIFVNKFPFFSDLLKKEVNNGDEIMIMLVRTSPC